MSGFYVCIDDFPSIDLVRICGGRYLIWRNIFYTFSNMLAVLSQNLIKVSQGEKYIANKIEPASTSSIRGKQHKISFQFPTFGDFDLPSVTNTYLKFVTDATDGICVKISCQV